MSDLNLNLHLLSTGTSLIQLLEEQGRAPWKEPQKTPIFNKQDFLFKLLNEVRFLVEPHKNSIFYMQDPFWSNILKGVEFFENYRTKI